MNKITRKPKGIQTRWVELKGWDFIREPIKMKKYFKQTTALNKRFKARCFKWYDEYENEYLYALWVFELVGNEYKERVHSGRCYKRFTKKIPYPTLTIRKMTTRWGVCNTRAKRVTLNLELMKKPIYCLDYVIMHELSHLIHPNHSKDFWALVEENCPEYKKIKKILKE